MQELINFRPFSFDSDELNLAEEESVSSIEENEPVIELSKEKSPPKVRGYLIFKNGKMKSKELEITADLPY